MKLLRNLAVAAASAALAACSGADDSASNNLAADTALESENLDVALNVDESLNGADLNAVDANAADANASANATDGADASNVVNAQ